mgnify:CR=1 FL=1|jgi:hypothetical protein
MLQPDDRILQSHRSQQGMALFVVLILVLVLTVVITQLLFVTKTEERISRNRQGRVSLSYAVQATARQVLQSLSSDLMKDLGYFDDGIEDDSLLGSSGGGGTQLPGGITLPGSNGEGPGESNTPTDTPHDAWAYPIQDSINQVQITGLVIDGESCIDLNHIFKLVLIAEEDSEEDGDSSGDSTEPGGEAGDEELLEEYIIPEQEEVDEATVMLERLIEAVIDFNSESGFDYNDVPDPQGAAEAIVSMVYQRVLDEQTRRIRSLDSIRHLDEVSWELFNGPIDPATLEEDYEGERGNSDEWMDDIGSLLPGSFDGLEAAGFELLDGGVDQIPTPIGLRHVLTANSTGKINLNTARPEVLIALMRSFDDFDEAREIAWQIRDHCNSYQQEIDEVTGEILENLLGDIGVDEEIEQQFQHFTSFDQLKQVDESWEDGGASEDSIFALLQQDLEEHSTFSSNFFTTTIEGTSEGRSLSGRMVCARKGQHVLVISWKEVRR